MPSPTPAKPIVHPRCLLMVSSRGSRRSRAGPTAAPSLSGLSRDFRDRPVLRSSRAAEWTTCPKPSLRFYTWYVAGEASLPHLGRVRSPRRSDRQGAGGIAAWQLNAKRGAVRFVRWRPQPTAVRLDNGAADRQPHAHAAGLGGEEGTKELVNRVRIDADAGVLHGDPDVIAV